jgi:hypothetical protein
MYKSNKQIAEEIKQSKLKKKTKKVVKRFDKSAEKKEYQDNIENFVMFLPNV